ncbi:MAG: CpXC domain-containing protein, partial [Anaerolineales bacterium]
MQLFDVTDNPMAKGQLLSGVANLIECKFCGFRGNYPTPIVYHDSEKEMLLTFVPPEVGIPNNEQERIIGSLINQVMNKLPQ